MALYYEALRLATSSVSVRNVHTNTGIGGKFLRAGNRILLPYRQMLFDSKIFGTDAEDFNPHRFLNDKKLSSSSSFRPFGGGATYCPGRFLAKAEVLTFVALVICRFNLDLAIDKGKPGGRFPIMETRRPCLGIMSPKEGEDVMLRVSRV